MKNDKSGYDEMQRERRNSIGNQMFFIMFCDNGTLGAQRYDFFWICHFFFVSLSLWKNRSIWENPTDAQKTKKI